MEEQKPVKIRAWLIAAALSAALGILGLAFRAWLAFPGLVLGAASIGAVSAKDAGGPGKRGAVRAIRILAGVGVSVSLMVLFALIVNLRGK